jgi:chromosomal replication initiation ATPase DnaA
MRKAKLWQKSDERILGDGDFVEQTLASSQESLEQKYALQARGYDIENVADRVCELLNVKRSDIWAPGKERYRVQARSLLCFWASRELKISQTELSLKFRLSPSTISLCVKRGEEMAQDNGYMLFSDETVNLKGVPLKLPSNIKRSSTR